MSRSQSVTLSRAAVLGLAGLVCLAAGTTAVAQPLHVFAKAMDSDLGPVQSVPERAVPPLPPPSTYPSQLVLDDGVSEGAFGFTSGSARQLLWLNRFANPGPFTLEEIWVQFPAGSDVPVGGDVQLAVYLDADGDPTNGATLLARFDETIQIADGVTFSVYPLATPLEINGAGDVLIGAINRYFMTGVDLPPTLPAAFDGTSPQSRSYVALWAADPPDPPELATATSVTLFTGATSGNFMIRGFGTPLPSTIPSLGGLGLALLAGLLGLLGSRRLARRA